MERGQTAAIWINQWKENYRITGDCSHWFSFLRMATRKGQNAK